VRTAKCQSWFSAPTELVNQREASKFHSALKLENFTHIISVMSPLGFVGVPAEVAGKATPP
jgi:hypothetical protein